jgi:dipeptidyl aminopeptidase/acylaminoacyl peptidase
MPVMKPLNFDENKEYPALLHFYGGPGSQKILVQHNKKFDMHLYTNRNHGIYGGQTRLHLFTKMVDYLKENL